jgi:hypothetical protein
MSGNEPKNPLIIDYEGSSTEQASKTIRDLVACYAACCLSSLTGAILADIVLLMVGRPTFVLANLGFAVPCCFAFPILIYWLPALWYLAWGDKRILVWAVPVIGVVSVCFFPFYADMIASAG